MTAPATVEAPAVENQDTPPAEESGSKSFLNALESKLGLESSKVEKDSKPPTEGKSSSEPTKDDAEPKGDAKPKEEKLADGSPSGEDAQKKARDIELENARLKGENEALNKTREKPKEDAPKGPRTIADFSDKELHDGIAHYKAHADEFENADELIDKAKAELTRRETVRIVEAKEAQNRAIADQAKWREKVAVDFPEIYKDEGGKKVIDAQSEMVQIANAVYKSRGLNQWADGEYRALEYAAGVLARRATSKEKSKEGEDKKAAPESKQNPAPMKGKPTSSAPNPTSDKSDEGKKQSDEALSRYDKSKSMTDLTAAIKGRIIKTK